MAERDSGVQCSIILNISNRYRRSPPDLSSHNTHGGAFGTGQSGRTVLPPLSTAFANPYPEHPHEPVPSRMSPGRNDVFSPSFSPEHWPSSGHAAMAGHPPYSYSPFELDQRYPTQTPQPPYPMRQSPGIPSGQDSMRRVPPITIPHGHREEIWAGDSGHMGSYPPSFSLHSMPEPGNIHSPSSSYPLNYDSPYHPNVHSSTYAPLYPSSMEARHLPHPHPHPMHFQQDAHQSSHRSSHPAEWGGSQRPDSHLVSPYARSQRDMMSHSPQDPSPVDYPVVKKKRKRADAAQLKILNEVYARTAFPTTEERQELAKKLDMSARSVQIWFQNKRQATRQSRTTSNALPPIMHHPYPNSSMPPSSGAPHPDHGSSRQEMSVSGHGGSYSSSRSPGRSSQQDLRVPSPRPPPDPYRRGRSPEDNGRLKRPGHPY